MRNLLAVIAGLVVGSVVNMAIITVGSMVIPPPTGIDMTDMDKFAENLKLLGPAHFIAPWLAHALGTLVGAFTAAKVAAGHKMKLALGIGILFFARRDHDGVDGGWAGVVCRVRSDRGLLAHGIPWWNARWSEETATGMTSQLPPPGCHWAVESTRL
jgi:hypothetical protein